MARQDETMTAEDSADLRPRRVKVSTQMQVRIPAALYQRYGFGSEALCVPTERGVEFRPMQSPVDQTADILQDLLDEGVSGERMVDEFRRRAAERLTRAMTPDEFDVTDEQIDLRGMSGAARR